MNLRDNGEFTKISFFANLVRGSALAIGFSRVAAILLILYDDAQQKLHEKETGTLTDGWKKETSCIFEAISQELATIHTIIFLGKFAEPMLLGVETQEYEFQKQSRRLKSRFEERRFKPPIPVIAPTQRLTQRLCYLPNLNHIFIAPISRLWRFFWNI